MPWIKRWMACALALAAMVVMAPSAAQAKWLRAESPRFIVYSDGDEKVLREQTAKLEAFDTFLRQMHGLPADGVPPRKLEVYLVNGTDGLRQVWPKVSTSIRGFYSASDEGIHTVLIRARKEDRTLFHEYTHHFMLQFFPYPYPAWLIEGYAEYFGASEVTGQQIEVGRFDQGRVDALLYLDWVSVEDLLTKRPFQLETGAAQASFYAQSWLLTHYLVSDPKRYGQLQAYMKAVGAGAEPDTAMETATGMSPVVLERTLRGYLRGGLPYGRYPISRKAEIAVTALPASADGLLLLNMRVKEANDDEDGSLIKTVREAAARYPGDRAATLTLARAEVRFGDDAAAEKALREFLVANPDDPEALVLLGTARMEIAEDSTDAPGPVYREAGKLFARAYKADPANYQALYGYARSRSVEPGYPNENDLEALLAANELAPQVGSITVQAARASMLRREWGQARALLQPLANSPHGGSAAETARKLLAQIDSVAPKTAAR